MIGAAFFQYLAIMSVRVYFSARPAASMSLPEIKIEVSLSISSAALLSTTAFPFFQYVATSLLPVLLDPARYTSPFETKTSDNDNATVLASSEIGLIIPFFQYR